MRFRSCFVALVLFLLTGAMPALGQDCVIGLHGVMSPEDPTSDKSALTVALEQTSAYVVLFTESVVDGASFNIEIEVLSTGLYQYIYNPTPRVGPSGNGFNLSSPGGYNVGFGECANGFGAQSILVAEFQLFFYPLFGSNRVSKSPVPHPVLRLSVVPNPDENESFPVFASCAEYVGECAIGDPLTFFVYPPIAVEGKSWGSVKSLF